MMARDGCRRFGLLRGRTAMSVAEGRAVHRPGSGSIPPETLEFIRKVRERVGTVVVGQDVVVERLLIALFTGGHLLLQGVPGLAKTLLVAALSKTIDLAFARIQFTIDLLPSDILGSEVLDQRNSDFRTIKGPIFTNLLLADEINRAAPKVQSALLEAMQERKVTIGKETYKLPAPFLVIATQNPVEQSGTFELPEDKGAIARTEFDALEGGPVGSTEQLVQAMEAIQTVHVSETFLEHVVEV